MEQCLNYSYSSEPKLLLIYIFGRGVGRLEALGLWCVILSASCYRFARLKHPSDANHASPLIHKYLLSVSGLLLKVL